MENINEMKSTSCISRTFLLCKETNQICSAFIDLKRTRTEKPFRLGFTAIHKRVEQGTLREILEKKLGLSCNHYILFLGPEAPVTHNT